MRQHTYVCTMSMKNVKKDRVQQCCNSMLNSDWVVQNGVTARKRCDAERAVPCLLPYLLIVVPPGDIQQAMVHYSIHVVYSKIFSLVSIQPCSPHAHDKNFFLRTVFSRIEDMFFHWLSRNCDLRLYFRVSLTDRNARVSWRADSRFPLTIPGTLRMSIDVRLEAKSI